jgi:hypothetical protein
MFNMMYATKVIYLFIYLFIYLKLVQMAARSKASTVFDRSKIGIAGSNPARVMDVCLRFFCVVLSCVGRGVLLG